MIDAITIEMAEALRARHGAHTVVLYGSRGRGEGTSASDYDLLGIGPVERTIRDAGLFQGHYLDAFVMPDARVAAPDASLVYMHGGLVVFEKDGAGTRLLEALAALHAAGPAPLTEDDAAMRRAWILKMIERIERGDLEAHLRRAMLMAQLLEDYCALRGRWYEGPRRGIAELQRSEPTLYALYERALQPGAPTADIAAAGRAFVAASGGAA